MRKKSERADIRKRQSRLGAVTKQFEHWAPAGEVLTAVRAVPTDFIQLDRATRVGGWPIQRFGIVHGPSSHGKTALCLGIGASFLRRDHLFGLVDAEMTTPAPWLYELMGELADSPGFVAKRPKTYDDTVLAVREFCEVLTKCREDGTVDRDTSGLLVVDSLQKLVPQKLIDKMLKHDDPDHKDYKGVDGAGGRSGMMLAALHSQWLRELIPLLYHSNTGMIIIVREYEKADARPFEQQFKVAGGKAPLFDSSIAARVERAAWVKNTKKRVIGERHKVTIHKTKVAGKDDKNVEFFFHTSNGNHIPPGFDRARDVIEIAQELKVVSRQGSTYWDEVSGERIGNGLDVAVKNLANTPEWLNTLEATCRKRFAGNQTSLFDDGLDGE